MGAGRKAQTFTINERVPSSPTTVNASVSARHLRKSDLGGVIFGCKHKTIAECLSKQLFGLPGPHFSYVKNIEPGLPLFLFNYSDRRLHGIFESASNGQMNIDPYGWTEDGTERTAYPAQVHICVRTQCQPLQEKQFVPAISDNFYSSKHFWFELDHAQAEHLISLFTSTSKGGIRGNLWYPLPNKCQSTGNARMNNMAGCSNGEPKSSSVWVQASHYEALTWDDISNNECGSSSLTSSSGHDGDFNPPELELESPTIDPSNVNFGCSSPCLDGQSRISESHLDKEVKENDEHMVLLKLKQLVLADRERLNPYQEECSVDVPSVIENIHQDDNQFLLDPSVSSVKNGMILPISSDLHSEIAQLRQGMQELKAFHMEQLQRNITLEKKLNNSDLELRQLKSRVVELESRWDQSTTHVGESSNALLDNLHSHALLDNLHSHPEGLIYLIGGFDGISWLPGLDSYSPSIDKITPLRPMNFARSYACATALNGDIYVIGGGINGDTWFDTVECYSPGANAWTPCPSLITRKGSLAGATIQSKLFAIGGGNGFECFSDVEMFDPALGRWINNASMLQKRFAPAAAGLNGVIYAVGGFDGKEYLKSAERFDPREASWTRLPSMCTRRGCHSLAVLDEKLYAMGGFDGMEMVPSVEVFDPRAGSWMMGDPMNSSRGYAATAVLGESVYVIGGVEIDKILLETVECYKEDVGWQATNLRAVGKRCFFSAIVL